MHLRRQIREAAAAILTGLATTGPRVFPSRVYPLAQAEMPGLCVYTNDGTSESSGGYPRTQQNVLELVVEGYAAANQDLDDTLDAIALEVEKAIAASVGLNGTAAAATISKTEVEFEPDAEQPHGRIRLTFDVEYFATEGAPDVAQ